MVAELRVAVALVDIKLGQEDGVALLRHIRTVHPSTTTIMMTAYASIDTAVEAMQAGAYDYLCKPFYTEDLLATLKRCFERRRLVADRETAEAAVRARNQVLNQLNQRLTQVLSDMQALARCEATQAVSDHLVDSVARLFEVKGAALYLKRDGNLVLAAPQGGTYSPRIAYPAETSGPLGSAFASQHPDVTQNHEGLAGIDHNDSLLVFPLHGADQAVLGVLLVHAPPPLSFSEQDRELGQILVSFGIETIQATLANENRANSEERLRQVIENSPSAISLRDPQGHYLLTNSRFKEWFADTQGPAQTEATNDVATDAPGDEPWDAHRDGPWDGAMASLPTDQAVINQDRATTREVKVASPSGLDRQVLVTRFPVADQHGRPIGVGTIGTDVTEQRQAEERLRRAQRMEAMGQLTGGVAHDFNNLLAVILGNLRLLQQDLEKRPDLLELVEEALGATKGGADLTGRLLAFGRDQPLHPEAIDIGQLVLGLSRLLERTLGEGIDIELDLAPDLWVTLVDRSQLESSLLNLAINARDAMPNGGRLLIRTRNGRLDKGDHQAERVDEDATRRVVDLSVIDNGAGMSPAVLGKAIQPFFTTKGAGHGSGLGLSMVYGFVTQSDGRLDITSEIGKGTNATLRFPASLTNPGVTRPSKLDPGAELRPGRGERVLVVEDQPAVRRMTCRQLTKLGYRVTEASDGRDALQILSESADIDVLFTDIVLPGEANGFELGQKALSSHPRLQVIYTTGHSPQTITQDPTVSSAIILRKPVQFEDLSQALRVTLGHD